VYRRGRSPRRYKRQTQLMMVELSELSVPVSRHIRLKPDLTLELRGHDRLIDAAKTLRTGLEQLSAG